MPIAKESKKERIMYNGAYVPLGSSTSFIEIFHFHWNHRDNMTSIWRTSVLLPRGTAVLPKTEKSNKSECIGMSAYNMFAHESSRTFNHNPYCDVLPNTWRMQIEGESEVREIFISIHTRFSHMKRPLINIAGCSDQMNSHIEAQCAHSSGQFMPQ